MDRNRKNCALRCFSAAYPVSTRSAVFRPRPGCAPWHRPPVPIDTRRFPVGHHQAGPSWLACSPTPEAVADGSWEKGADCTPCVLSPDRTDHGIWLLKDGTAELVHIDICAPVMHGEKRRGWHHPRPVRTGPHPLRGLRRAGQRCLHGQSRCQHHHGCRRSAPHCKWASAIRAELEGDHKTLLDSIEQRLGYPIFVKPANAGSSVGITKATDRAALEQAVVTALKEDDKVVFEEFIDGQEVEVRRHRQPRRPRHRLHHPPRRNCSPGAEFYTYDDKYKNGVSQTVDPRPSSSEGEDSDEVRTEARARTWPWAAPACPVATSLWSAAPAVCFATS